MDIVRSSSGLLLPRAAVQRDLDEMPESTCPAASVVRFKGSGRPAIRCRVEGNAFAIEDNPTGAAMWCCGDYTACPVWTAAKEGDPVVERVADAKEQGVQDATTRRQIEQGVRFDDRGQESGESD